MVALVKSKKLNACTVNRNKRTLTISINASRINTLIKRQVSRIDIPEVLLWYSVIAQSVCDLANNESVQETQYFLKSEGFERICAVLQLNVEYVRTLIDKLNQTVELNDSELYQASL